MLYMNREPQNKISSVQIEGTVLYSYIVYFLFFSHLPKNSEKTNSSEATIVETFCDHHQTKIFKLIKFRSAKLKMVYLVSYYWPANKV